MDNSKRRNPRVEFTKAMKKNTYYTYSLNA